MLPLFVSANTEKKIILQCDSQSHTLFCSLYDNAHRKDVLNIQPVSYQAAIVWWVKSTRTSHCRVECFWTEKRVVVSTQGWRRSREDMTQISWQICDNSDVNFKKKNTTLFFFSVEMTSRYYVHLAQAVVGLVWTCWKECVFSMWLHVGPLWHCLHMCQFVCVWYFWKFVWSYLRGLKLKA